MEKLTAGTADEIKSELIKGGKEIGVELAKKVIDKNVLPSSEHNQPSTQVL